MATSKKDTDQALNREIVEAIRMHLAEQTAKDGQKQTNKEFIEKAILEALGIGSDLYKNIKDIDFSKGAKAGEDLRKKMEASHGKKGGQD